MKKEQKFNQGITLIALVITIIVLLILAGVSVATLTGENGIVTKATTAKEETRGGAVEEAKDLWKTEKEADNYDTNQTAKTLDGVLAELKEQKLLTDEEVATIKETGRVTIGSREIIFFEQLPELDGYILYADMEKSSLEIVIDEDKLLERYWDNKLSNLTDEEIFAKAITMETGEETTFEKEMKELYQNKQIKEEYKTLREYCYGEMEGMTETEYNSGIKSLKKRISELSSDEKIEEITNPDDTPYEGGYEIPIAEKDYTFTVKIAGEEEIKLHIGQYEVVHDSQSNCGYALDVNNKKYLKINKAKINVYGNEINVNQYLQEEEEWNRLAIGAIYDEIIENYKINPNLQTRARTAVLCKTIFECDEGKAEGYLGY